MDDRQDRFGVFPRTLNHRIVAEILAKIVVAIEAVGDHPRAELDRSADEGTEFLGASVRIGVASLSV